MQATAEPFLGARVAPTMPYEHATDWRSWAGGSSASPPGRGG
jgi:hypothetical protein